VGVSVRAMMMVVMVMTLGVEDAVSHLVHTSTEGVVVAFDGEVSQYLGIHRDQFGGEVITERKRLGECLPSSS
jgi:hypothetical protein